MTKYCTDCGGKREIIGATLDKKRTYEHYKCVTCGEEVLDMKQLQEVKGIIKK